jgi:hypothetical protein
MAVDTAEKRYSMLNVGQPWFRILPEVDGGIEADDRLHLLGLYSGIAATAVAVAPTIPGMEWTLDETHPHWTLDAGHAHWTPDSNPIDWTLDKE